MQEDRHTRTQSMQRARYDLCERNISRAGTACRRPCARTTAIRVQTEGNMGVTRQDTLNRVFKKLKHPFICCSAEPRQMVANIQWDRTSFLCAMAAIHVWTETQHDAILRAGLCNE